MSIKTVLQCDLCKITEMDEPIGIQVPIKGRDSKHLCGECGDCVIRILEFAGVEYRFVPPKYDQGPIPAAGQVTGIIEVLCDSSNSNI